MTDHTTPNLVEVRQYEEPTVENMMRAAFRSGWVAACHHIAENLRANGGADLAEFFMGVANEAPDVVVGIQGTPKGEAIAATPRSVIAVERSGEGGK